MNTPLTDRINLLTSQANAVTEASDTNLSDAVNTLIAGFGTGGGGTVDLLRTVTFENTNEQIAITPDASWAQYNFLLFVPDLTITTQEGQTAGNWLFFRIIGNRGGGCQYEGTGNAGKRDTGSMLVLSKGWNTDRYVWVFSFISGRSSSLMLKDIFNIDSETFSDLTYEYGGYYQSTYGLLNGTVKIYGGKF